MVSVQTIFQSTLLPASWRGVPFFVLEADVKAGTRAFTHQYPFRDTPYTEPLGREARQYSFTGYLEGDDVNAQLFIMLTALEADGPGVLIHPSLGPQTVIALPAEITQTIAGRYVEIKFHFVEAGQVIYPTNGADTQAATINSAAQNQPASQTGFSNGVNNAASGNVTIEDIQLSTPPPSTDPATLQANDLANAGFGGLNTV